MKDALRGPLRAARRSRASSERTGLARAIADVGLAVPAIRDASCVALYASLPDEPGTGPLRERLRARGTRVLLPIVPGTARPEGDDASPSRVAGHGLDWAVDDGELVTGAGLGMPEPAGAMLGAGALDEADVVLVPALAVDGQGNRLGKGRGYYDAALRHAAPGALVLAVLFDEEVLSAPIPREGHDVPVAGALTPTRWVLF